MALPVNLFKVGTRRSSEALNRDSLDRGFQECEPWLQITLSYFHIYNYSNANELSSKPSLCPSVCFASYNQLTDKHIPQTLRNSRNRASHEDRYSLCLILVHIVEIVVPKSQHSLFGCQPLYSLGHASPDWRSILRSILRVRTRMLLFIFLHESLDNVWFRCLLFVESIISISHV